MTINAEPSFGYHFGEDPTFTYGGWHWTAGSEGQAIAPGDIVIAQIIVNVDFFHTGSSHMEAIGISSDGSDWIQDVDAQYNFPSGYSGFSDPDFSDYTFDTAQWHKVWQEGDDPNAYEVFFAGYPIDNEAWSEVNINLYVVHGGDGAVSFVDDGDASPIVAAFDGQNFSRNFGAGGASWDVDLATPGPAPKHNSGFYPAAVWSYYVCTGATVFCAALFGGNFSTSLDFQPASSFDELGPSSASSGDGNDALHAHVIEMWSQWASGVRASRRPAVIRRISVS